MGVLTNVLRVEIEVLLASLAIIIVYKMLTGRINLHGLLSGEDGNPSAARVQLLVATLVAAFAYLSQVIDQPGEFPAVPTWLLLGLGGSQIVYLWSKAQKGGG